MGKQKVAPSAEALLSGLEAENSENFTQNVEDVAVNKKEEENIPMFQRQINEQNMNKEVKPTQSVNQREKVIKDEQGNYVFSSRVALEDEIRGRSGKSSISPENEIGWIRLGLDCLPSNGYFYPKDVELYVRSAEMPEIIQWSSINSYDKIDVSDKMNMILERCVKLRCNSKMFTWQDLDELDRNSLILKIRELTFPNGENTLMVPFKCKDCGKETRLPLDSDMLLGALTINDEIWKYYNPEERCFSVHSDKLGEDIVLFVPTIGTVSFLQKYIRQLVNDGVNINPAITKLMPFFVRDWRRLSDDVYRKMSSNMSGWSRNKFFFINKFVDMFNEGVDTVTLKCNCEKCGVVMERPIFFRGGYTIKDFFLFSGKLDELI